MSILHRNVPRLGWGMLQDKTITMRQWGIYETSVAVKC
jgi:hypothetical protein